MKKLYSSPNGFVGHIAGQAVTGGISYSLADTEDIDVRLKRSRNQLQELEFEFPDSATNARYRQIFNGCEDAVKAAKIYLAELTEQGVIEKPAAKPVEPKPAAKTAATK